MTQFQEKLHSILSLYKDNFDLLTISDSVEKLFDDEIKTRTSASYDKGFSEGKKAGNKKSEMMNKIYGFGTNLLGVTIFCVGICLISHYVAGCNVENMKTEIARMNYLKQQEPEIAKTVSACSNGDYETCRAGWIKFNTEAFTNVNTSGVKYNTVCSSLEEAYFQKTKKPLILNEMEAYFHEK